MSGRCLRLAGFLAVLAAPATARAVASAELFKDQPYRYGRFEARIRYAAGDGVISSFFLWKVGSEVAGTYWNELDFEKLGADCRMQTNTLYANPLKSGEQTRTMPADMCSAYHDYRFEWTPTYIAWSIDAQEIRRETGAVAAAFADNAPEGMRMHFNVWPGNANFGGNFSPAILPVRQFISWVQYSSFQNGSFKQEWREDFNGAGVPSGWTTGTWASPLNLSTHDARNVTFSNGIAVLSLTADNATGFSGAPPADNAGGMGGAGGSANAGAANGGTNTGGTSNGGASAGGSGGKGGSGGGGGLGGGKASGGAAGASGLGGSATSGGAVSGGSAGAGQPGSGGVATGGTPSAGTTNGGAGSSSMSGGASTGGALTGGTANPASGGSNSTGGSTGGTPSGGAFNGGAATTAGNAGTDSASGCGCRVAPQPRPHAFAAGLLMLTALTARRRARSKKPRA